MAYLSPEEVLTPGPSRALSRDIYRAGVLLREILRGAPTDLGGQPPLSYALQLMAKTPPDVPAECPNSSRELTSMVVQMLGKKPSDRGVSLPQMAQLLSQDSENWPAENS